jgi:succinate dehydrogenase / fumarate reductase cytochrome b subunit
MKRSASMSPFWNSRWSRISIIQRYIVFVLMVGLITLVYFLWAVTAGDQSYARATKLFVHPLFRAFLIILTWSSTYHLLAGIRHLSLDAGYGFERSAARASGIAVIIVATLLTLPALLPTLLTSH